MSTSLEDLGEDILLRILSFLPLSTIACLQSVSRFFDSLICSMSKKIRQQLRMNIALLLPFGYACLVTSSRNKERYVCKIASTKRHKRLFKSKGKQLVMNAGEGILRVLQEVTEKIHDIQFDDLILQINTSSGEEWGPILRVLTSSLSQHGVRVSNLKLKWLRMKETTQEDLLHSLRSLRPASFHVQGIYFVNRDPRPILSRDFFCSPEILRLKSFSLEYAGARVEIDDEILAMWNFDVLQIRKLKTNASSQFIRNWIANKLESGRAGQRLELVLNNDERDPQKTFLSNFSVSRMMNSNNRFMCNIKKGNVEKIFFDFRIASIYDLVYEQGPKVIVEVLKREDEEKDAANLQSACGKECYEDFLIDNELGRILVITQ